MEASLQASIGNSLEALIKFMDTEGGLRISLPTQGNLAHQGLFSVNKSGVTILAVSESVSNGGNVVALTDMDFQVSVDTQSSSNAVQASVHDNSVHAIVTVM